MHQIYGIAAIVGVGGFFLGYDVGIISGVLAMDGFADVFGTVAVPGAKAFLWLNLHADYHSTTRFSHPANLLLDCQPLVGVRSGVCRETVQAAEVQVAIANCARLP